MDGGKSSRCAFRVFAVAVLLRFGLGVLVAGASSQQLDEEDLWTSLRTGEAFVMMRHALAPGTGDPANFDIDDCSTQRNLSDGGRRQASSIGDRFRQNEIEAAAVFSSQWCRCFETAELLELGPVFKLKALNSFFQHYERRDVQTQALGEWLHKRRFGEALPLVLVTHQVNITAATDVYPSSGEIVFCRLSDKRTIEVLGRISN